MFMLAVAHEHLNMFVFDNSFPPAKSWYVPFIRLGWPAIVMGMTGLGLFWSAILVKNKPLKAAWISIGCSIFGGIYALFVFSFITYSTIHDIYFKISTEAMIENEWIMVSDLYFLSLSLLIYLYLTWRISKTAIANSKR